MNGHFTPMTELEPRTSGIGSDCSTTWGTTTARKNFLIDKNEQPTNFLRQMNYLSTIQVVQLVSGFHQSSQLIFWINSSQIWDQFCLVYIDAMFFVLRSGRDSQLF